MKPILFLVALLASQNTWSETLNYRGDNFLLSKKQGLVLITPEILDGKIQRVGQGDFANLFDPSLNCQKLDDLLEKKERKFKTCQRRPQSSSCRYFKDYLREVAYGRVYELANTKRDIPQRWSVSDGQRYVYSSQELKNQVAELYSDKDLSLHLFSRAVRSENSEIVKIQGMNIQGTRWLKKIATLLELDLSNDLSIHPYADFLETRNRILTCEILAERVEFTLEIKNEYHVHHKTPSDILSKIWRAYKIFERDFEPQTGEVVLQAANVGFHIGQSVLALKENVSGPFSIPKLFPIFVSGEEDLRVSSIENLSILKERFFPNRDIEEMISQKWMVR